MYRFWLEAYYFFGVVVVAVGGKLITVVRYLFDLSLGVLPIISEAIYSISSSTQHVGVRSRWRARDIRRVP